jgi:hypothetical protein
MTNGHDMPWWGYLHVDGTIHVKRFSDHRDLVEAQASPFVSKVIDVFNAPNREEAVRITTQTLRPLS